MLFGAVFPLLCVALLIGIEQGLEVSYGWKTAAKITLFVVIPFLLFRSSRLPFLRFRHTDKQQVRLSLLLGIATMLVIVIAFLLVQPMLDLEALRLDLVDAGITRFSYPFIALYIMLGNSWIEEFFFRGILKELFGQSKLRFVLPPFFFAIYHIAIFLPWFTLPILLLAIGGLWIGGLLFQWINEKSGTILPSWIIHIFADIGILLVGISILY